MIIVACLSFVLYQSHECWLKYYGLPKFTDVSFQKAESYPEVTFCHKNLKVRVKTGFSFNDTQKYDLSA